SRSAGRRARSRSSGFATSRGRAAATRSSCSSASTPTGSRAASASAGYCVVQPGATAERLRLSISIRLHHPENVRRLVLLGFLGAAVLAQSSGATSVTPGSLVLRQTDVPTGYRLNPNKSG